MNKMITLVLTCPLANVPMRELKCRKNALTLRRFLSFLWSFDLVLDITEVGGGPPGGWASTQPADTSLVCVATVYLVWKSTAVTTVDDSGPAWIQHGPCPSSVLQTVGKCNFRPVVFLCYLTPQMTTPGFDCSRWMGTPTLTTSTPITLT